MNVCETNGHTIPVPIHVSNVALNIKSTNKQTKKVKNKKNGQKKIILHFYVDSAVKITDTEHQKFIINIFSITDRM